MTTTMSHKRRGQEDRRKSQHLAAGGKRSRRWSKQQHLYLVLDDWDRGFSIHKIDADDGFERDDDDDDYSDSSGDDEDHHHQQYHHLAEPPVLRFESPGGNDQSYLAASGTKMFVVLNQRSGLVYDADTAVLAVATHAPPRMVFGFGVCMPVGDVLYLLSHRLSDTTEAPAPHSFDALSWSPAGGGGWAWKTLPAPPPTFAGRQIVVAHALHPDGRTIFMTTAYRDTPGAPVGTFSFDTREGSWRWHGECALPFDGQGHFDAELDAWVGLRFDGRICACQVISPDFVVVSERPPNNPKRDSIWGDLGVDPSVYLEHQTTEEKLFGNHGCTMRASLTYMQGTGRFCLVECVPSKVTKRPAFGDNDGCVLHVTIFGLKYSHKGELQTKNHRSTRSFLVSRHRSYFGPFAFWT